jgi:hypothetical protein
MGTTANVRRDVIRFTVFKRVNYARQLLPDIRATDY